MGIAPQLWPLPSLTLSHFPMDIYPNKYPVNSISESDSQKTQPGATGHGSIEMAFPRKQKIYIL